MHFGAILNLKSRYFGVLVVVWVIFGAVLAGGCSHFGEIGTVPGGFALSIPAAFSPQNGSLLAQNRSSPAAHFLFGRHWSPYVVSTKKNVFSCLGDFK